MHKLSNIIKTIPKKPGVYQFLDKSEEIIYIGKAKNLRNRVKSYFQEETKLTPKTRVMIKNSVDIHYIEVDSDLEAILLETNLIKEHKPKYNILMKDDKNFIYLKITSKEAEPKIYLTRRLENDNATYIGPKTSGYDIKKYMKIIEGLLPYENCQINIENLKNDKIKKSLKNKSICQIKNLDSNHSPCISDLKKEDYHELIKKIVKYFKGDSNDILKELEEKMKNYALNKEFEKAAKLRDKIFNIQSIIEKQKITNAKPDENIDVFGVSQLSNMTYVIIFQIRQGKIINQSQIDFKNPLEVKEEELYRRILTSYYQSTQDYPNEILTPYKIEEDLILEINKICNKKIKIITPKIGRKTNLINLAQKNAESFMNQKQIKWLEKDAQKNTLIKLKEILNLKKTPKRIECYDISHLKGEFTIGSMVVFKEGKSSKKDYRQFNLKTLEEKKIDDFKSLNEVLKRRLKYIASPKKGLRTNLKDSTFTIKDQNKIIGTLDFKELENNNIEILKTECSKDFHLSFLLKKFAEKTKAKKIYYKNKNQEFLIAGFQEIKHQDYKIALYLKKDKKDESLKQIPDLIVIDGGKGQLKKGIEAKKDLNIEIPMVSISKKLETLHLESGENLNLGLHNRALNLIQQLRDEAHRFAITKNRKARIKKLTHDE
jgi:excinuclease ABC subunit C